MGKSLKEENQKSLWVFYSINIVLYISIFILGEFDVSDFKNLLTQFISKNGWLFLIGPVIVSIANGLLNSNIKAILVFWRVKNVLPGCRSFTKLAPNDPRIDMESLKTKIDKFPIAPKDQNTVWYKLSKLHEEKLSVRNSHKQYLLLRDITSFSSLILLLTFISHFFFEISVKIILIYLSLLIIQYIITAYAGRVYGNRFVCNVLAEESSRN